LDAQLLKWEQIKEQFSFKAFKYSLIAIGSVYLLLFIWVFINADTTRQEKQDRLASITVSIEHSDTPVNLTDKKQPASDTKKAPIPGTDSPPEIKKRPDIGDYPDLVKMDNGLVAMPVEGLSESSGKGPLPVKRKDGLTVFDAYRRPFDRSYIDAPLISIAIMNLGLSSAATESAIKNMPEEISLILSPYAGSLDFWVSEARSYGHEVWLTLPTETESYPLRDPGPHTLLINATEIENQRKLEWTMSQTEGYVGFVTEYHPNFINAYNDMRPIVGNIYNRGLAFVDGFSEPTLIPQSMALGAGAPYATIDVWIDIEPSKSQITANLKKLEEIARERGMAAGVIHAYPVSYQHIKEWASDLERSGFVLAPLSAQTGM
jgi:polysaccharide deacetylase 2 family uncharacterized protein YibQ